MTTSQKLYMAPMLGITDACFRDVYSKYYGFFDEAISPYVRTKQGERFQESHAKDLLRQKSKLNTIPQILSNQSRDFINLAKIFYKMGFEEVNLNMGCPVPSAMGKGRGAGLLLEKDHTEKFLTDIIEQIPNKLSIKTRIGFDDDRQLEDIVGFLNELPIECLFIHPRTARQKYGGDINYEKFQLLKTELNIPVVYSGEIHTYDDWLNVQKILPCQNLWMLGRGILKNPELLQRIRGESFEHHHIYLQFIEELFSRYRERDLSEQISLLRLKTLVFYYCDGKNVDRKILKKVKKSRDFLTFFAELGHIFSSI